MYQLIITNKEEVLEKRELKTIEEFFILYFYKEIPNSFELYSNNLLIASYDAENSLFGLLDFNTLLKTLPYDYIPLFSVFEFKLLKAFIDKDYINEFMISNNNKYLSRLQLIEFTNGRVLSIEGEGDWFIKIFDKKLLVGIVNEPTGETEYIQLEVDQIKRLVGCMVYGNSLLEFIYEKED